MFQAMLFMALLWNAGGGKPGAFADFEKTRILSYWNAPGRYKVSLPPSAKQKGPWQVRLTVEGSLWLWKYQQALGLGKVAPTMDAKGDAPQTAEWEKWVAKKVEYDRWLAQNAAEAANQSFLTPQTPAATPKPAPADPGAIPPALLAAAGNPPPFAHVATPLQHVIVFEDGEALAYSDHVDMRPRYAYYRFAQGVVSYGVALKNLPETEIKPIFEASGFTPAEQRIARAVSALEGGFDSVNTYDTGYVSVGFLQFITFDTGRESLCEVLLKEKTDRPEVFEKDFRQYGIDVTPEGILTVLDPGTGAELIGPEAVRKVIDDKRLIAVFQRAGKHSLGFRVAQVQVAKNHYWPANDSFSVLIEGKPLTGKVSDIVRSEAGIATLFDRKVNRGNITPFADVVSKVMAKYRLKTLDQAAQYEKEILQSLKYREDFLKDKSLSQPAEPPAAPQEKKREKKEKEEEPIETP